MESKSERTQSEISGDELVDEVELEDGDDDELVEDEVELGEEEKKSFRKKKTSKRVKAIIEDFNMIDYKYFESKFDDIKSYDVRLQREILTTLLKYRIFEKDVSKYWKIKCNQIKMAIYRGYNIPINELQLLEMSELIDDEMNESKNLIYFYAYIAHRWNHIRSNLDKISDAGSFKILFYQTYMSCMYMPLDSLESKLSTHYKVKVQTLPKTPLYVYYTYNFTQDYISNLALSLEYYNNEYTKFSCCIISDMNPKKNDVVKINDYKTILEDSKFSSETSLLFSFMNISEFILDVFSHMLNPEINMIDSESKKDLFERQSGNKIVKRYTPDQLPQILRTDIVSKYLNMKLGNILTVDNVNLVFESITPASRTVRVCTNTDIIKKSR